jgi:hypothetical protein
MVDDVIALLAGGSFWIVGDIRPCAHTDCRGSACGPPTRQVAVDRIRVVGRGVACETNRMPSRSAAPWARSTKADWHGPGCSVLVEYPGQIADDEPNCQHIQIAIVSDCSRHNRCHRYCGHRQLQYIGNHQLIVHATVTRPKSKMKSRIDQRRLVSRLNRRISTRGETSGRL